MRDEYWGTTLLLREMGMGDMGGDQYEEGEKEGPSQWCLITMRVYTHVVAALSSCSLSSKLTGMATPSRICGMRV